MDLLAKKKSVLDCVVRPYSSSSNYPPKTTGTGFYFFNGTLIYKFFFYIQLKVVLGFVKAEMLVNMFSCALLETAHF